MLIAMSAAPSDERSCAPIRGEHPTTFSWHARVVAAGLNITSVEDRPWGMHEFTLTDPSGNNIRVGRNVIHDEDESS